MDASRQLSSDVALALLLAWIRGVFDCPVTGWRDDSDSFASVGLFCCALPGMRRIGTRTRNGVVVVRFDAPRRNEIRLRRPQHPIALWRLSS